MVKNAKLLMIMIFNLKEETQHYPKRGI